MRYVTNHPTRTAGVYMEKYPKFLLLFITIIIAYIMFYGKTYPPLQNFLSSAGYLGTFISGIFFVYGFTAAPATVILLVLAKEQNIWVAGLIGGLGALIGDLIIFKFLRVSFADEVSRLMHEKLISKVNKKVPNIFKKYLIPVFAGFIIASPLPDEIGVALLAINQNISMKIFTIISYVLNTIGIYVILLIGTSI
ncbi:MAG: hypothetical protein AABX25_03625 [Nanoarchaeota archaeon]